MGGSSLYDRFLLASSALADAEIASRVGFSRSTIWRARRGRTRLSAQSRDRLVAVLDDDGEIERQAAAVDALLELAVRREDVRRLIVSLSATLLHE